MNLAAFIMLAAGTVAAPTEVEGDPGKHSPGLSMPEEYSSLSLFGTTRRITGWTRVRELNSIPTRLDLEDLNIDPSLGFSVEYTRVWTNYKFTAIFEHFPIGGKGELPFDIIYDEGTFIANRPFDIVNGNWYHFSGFFEWIPEFLKEKKERLAFVTGIRFDQFHLGLDNGPEHSTEDYNQFLPYPAFGFDYERHILPDIFLQLRTIGSIIPKSRTFFVEGGSVYMRINQSDVQARVIYRMADSVQLVAGFGYLSWKGTLESSEDGNEITLHAPSYSIGIAFNW